jgi:hypothetical protein
MRKLSLIFIVIIGWLFTMNAQVAINITGAIPDASSGLDVSFTNKGLLIPRVALTATNVAGPITSPTTSLLVYNTATASSGATAVTPGYYYWTGTEWSRVLDAASGKPWLLTGNAGTVAGTNFIGTTDAIDFVVKTNNTEKFRVQSGGNVGIGTIAPSYKLDVTSTIRAQDVFAAGGQNIIVGDDSYLSDVDLGNIMGVYGNTNTDRGGIKFGSGGATIFGYNNNIGIGTITPAYTLDLNTGTFAFGNGNSRTQTRDDAGLQGNAGAQSGFFETSSPTNYPAGASGWWHLIDVRHSNTGNNYAMQLAGSFGDQKLYFRKTNGSATTTWNEVTTAATETYTAVSLLSDISIPNTTFTDISGMTLTFTAKKSTILVTVTASGHGYTNSMAYVSLRVWNTTTNTLIGGCSNKMQSYDDTKGTVTVWSTAYSKLVTGLTPGTTYSFKVQGEVAAIYGTDDAIIYPVSYPDDEHLTLTVFY